MIPVLHVRHVPNLLRRIRKCTGLRAEDVAHRANVCRSAVYKRESGAQSLSMVAFVEHAAALGYQVVLIPATPREGSKK